LALGYLRSPDRVRTLRARLAERACEQALEAVHRNDLASDETSHVALVDCAALEIAGAHAVKSCGALDGCQGPARSFRTNVTCVWGVSDPRKLGAGP
jgi:hypothetical protein